MTLSGWLEQSGLSDAEFAERIGVSRQALWRYKAAARMPRPETVSRIQAATGGKVTANDFMSFLTAPAAPSSASAA